MLHFYDRAAIAHALNRPDLPLPLRLHITALTGDLIDWTEYVVIQPGDTEPDIVRAVGFSPLTEPLEGARFGTPGFEPFWDWLAAPDGWFELIVTFGSTFAYILLIEDTEGVDPELLALCRTYARS